MRDTPERLWACAASVKHGVFDWERCLASVTYEAHEDWPEPVEYVRKDLYDAQKARIAELEVAARELATRVSTLQISSDRINSPVIDAAIDAMWAALAVAKEQGYD